MALPGFAEQHCFDGAAGAQRLFNEAHAFHTDKAGFRGQATPKRYAKLLEPAIVAAGDRRRSGAIGTDISSEFARCGHYTQRSKFPGERANLALSLRAGPELVE